MHVLILPSWYPRYDGDAEGSFFRDQAHALAKAGLQVGVVFPDLRGPARYVRKGRAHGITSLLDGSVAEVRSHGFNWFPGQMAGFEWLWRRHARKALGVYFERFGKPDVIHVHSMEPAATVAADLVRSDEIPFIITEHSTFHIRELASDYTRRKCSRLARASSKNLAVSEVFAEKLNTQYGGNWSYLPNIVADRFLDAPLISRPHGEFRLVSVALLSQRKRMDLVIDAVHLLRTRGHDVALTIIGDGPEREGLERQAADLVQQGKVEFAGQVSISDMPARLAEGHLLVSASEFETFGVTLIEAMALGMPVVATRSGGPDSIVTAAVGRLVDQWSAVSIADAIESVITNLDEFEPANIRSHCESHYSASVISESLKSIYGNVISHVS